MSDRATLDTNVLPSEELVARAMRVGIDCQITTVTRREVADWTERAKLGEFDPIPEVFVFDETRLDEGVLGTDSDGDVFESALHILSNGGFPQPGARRALTSGQRRQLRDALILCTHVRAEREILVSNDTRAFVDHGRREAIQERFGTKVLTAAEFEDYLSELEEGADDEDGDSVTL